MNRKIKIALISVSDKTNLDYLANNLALMDIKIYSTGGTLDFLLKHNIPATNVSDLTLFPEMMGGRVKTLHPNIHAALLGIRNNRAHTLDAQTHNIKWIDLVIVNLYPFHDTISSELATSQQAIENIDIGGPSMLRSAAKNFDSVTAISDHNDYPTLLSIMKKHNGKTTLAFRKTMAAKVFQLTSNYDNEISSFLNKNSTTDTTSPESLPQTLNLTLKKESNLRYGENPHQAASVFAIHIGNRKIQFSDFFKKLHGKELSYNNILDLHAAAALIDDFANDIPTAAIFKHTNPCGVASASNLITAYRNAFATDTISPFGGIVALNKPLDIETATAIDNVFTEIILAPDYDQDVIPFLMKKTNRRIIAISNSLSSKSKFSLSFTGAGTLIQERDTHTLSPANLKAVTKRKPTKTELDNLIFSWKVCKHVKSNAIVYAKNTSTLGIGAGQMSRVDAAIIARQKAQSSNLSLLGSSVASDAFFPFADGLLSVADAGATSIIQPGGSIRDKEVIDAANERNIAMIFTNIRHFKH